MPCATSWWNSGSSSKTRPAAPAGSVAEPEALLNRPFRSDDSTHDRGRQAETEGRRWLESLGYETVASNYRTPVGEIDLVAREDDTLCFIEIKARETTAYGQAIAGVTPLQQSRVARAAALYLQETDYDGFCRFDVLGMDWADTEWRFELIRNAFQVA